MRERLEPLIKRHETDMRLQHGNQLLVHSPQTLGLCARLVELPKQDRISQQKHQYDGEKTECQARTDIETVQVKVALANLFRPSGRFHDRHTLLPIACLKRQEADPQSKHAETIAIHALKEFYHRTVNLASTAVRASNQLFEPIPSLTLPPPQAHSFPLSAPHAKPQYTLLRLLHISRRPRSMDAPPHGLPLPPIWPAEDTVAGYPVIRKAPVLWGSPHALRHLAVERPGGGESGPAPALPANAPMFGKPPDHSHPTHWHSRHARRKTGYAKLRDVFWTTGKSDQAIVRCPTPIEGCFSRVPHVFGVPLLVGHHTGW